MKNDVIENDRKTQTNKKQVLEDLLSDFKKQLEELNVLKTETGQKESSFILQIEKDQEIDYEKVWQPMLMELERFWESLSVKPYELIPLFLTIDLINSSTPHQIGQLFEEFQIIITPKDKKKGRNGAITRLQKNYYKPLVREKIKSLGTMMMRDACRIIKEGEDKEKVIEQLVDEQGYFAVWYPINVLLEDKKDWNSLLMEMFPSEHILCLIDLFQFYQDINYEQITKLSYQQEAGHSLQFIKLENKKMKLKMNQKEKETSSLKKTVFHLNKEKKQLQGEIHQLYGQALEEIEELKKQLENERVAFMKVIDEQSETINQFMESKDQLNRLDMQERRLDKLSLEGQVIAVVGGDRIRYIREVIEKYKGTLEFVPETDITLIEGAVSRSHVVFFMKEFAGHHLFRKTITSAEKFDVPFRFVNTKGVSGFERTLREYIYTLNLKDYEKRRES